MQPGRDDVAFVIRDEDLAACVVRGEVVTAADATPFGAFQVELVTFPAEGRAQARRVKARIDGNRFELPGLPPTGANPELVVRLPASVEPPSGR